MWKWAMAAGVAAALSMAPSAFAQQATPPAANPPAATKAATKSTAASKARSAESLECSKQADAKGLHGKARKTFRSQCLKDLKKKS